jgi:FkbM family methyltransferase
MSRFQMAYQRKSLLSVNSRERLKRLIPRSIYLKYFGRHEKISLRIWELLAASIAGDFSILDIGAFHGEFALVARRVNKASAIIAFEPNPESLKILRVNCLNDQITIVDKAVSDEDGEVSFHCDSQISSITTTNFERPTSLDDTIKVDAITLDSWTNANSRMPRLIKVDVEDAADQVLRGAKFLLKEHRPAIICEILSDQIGGAAMESLKRDYQYFLINENWGLEKKTIVKRYDWRYKNWLFVPTDDDSSLELLRANLVSIKLQQGS